MGDKKQNSTGTTEKDVSTALVKLERPEKKVYFTTGHGERVARRLRPAGLRHDQAGADERDNFTTAPLNLVTARAVPDDAAEVVIAGPTNPFLPEEKDALKAYLDGGGKLIAIIGPELEDRPERSAAAVPGGVHRQRGRRPGQERAAGPARGRRRQLRHARDHHRTCAT